MALRLLTWGDDLGLYRWVHGNHKGSYKEGCRVREGDVMMQGSERERGSEGERKRERGERERQARYITGRCYTASFEDG